MGASQRSQSGACTPGFLCKQKGKSASAFDSQGYCKSMGKSYNGYGWSANGGVAKISVTCSGAKFNVKCAVSGSMTIKSCTGPKSRLFELDGEYVAWTSTSGLMTIGVAFAFAALAMVGVVLVVRRTSLQARDASLLTRDEEELGVAE